MPRRDVFQCQFCYLLKVGAAFEAILDLRIEGGARIVLGGFWKDPASGRRWPLDHRAVAHQWWGRQNRGLVLHKQLSGIVDQSKGVSANSNWIQPTPLLMTFADEASIPRRCRLCHCTTVSPGSPKQVEPRATTRSDRVNGIEREIPLPGKGGHRWVPVARPTPRAKNRLYRASLTCLSEATEHGGAHIQNS